MNDDERGLRVTRLDATLSRDEGGQISVLAVLGAAAFACLLILIINTGWTTSSKIGMQNAADATAISGATWVARALNIISLNNVTSSQMLAMILIFRALDDSIPIALEILEAEKYAVSLIPYVGAALALIIQAQIIALKVIETSVDVLIQTVDANGNGLFWTTMKILQGVSLAVQKSFGFLALAEGDRVALQNGADFGLVVSRNIFPGVPAEKGTMRPDLCDPTERGPFTEYSDGVRTATYIWINSGLPAFFEASRRAAYSSLCGGSTEGPPTTRRVGSLAECRLRGGGIAYWAAVLSDVWSDTPKLPPMDAAVLFNTREDTPKIAERTCDWPSPFFNAKHHRETVSGPRQVEIGKDKDGNPIYRYIFTVRDYSFLSAALGTEDPAQPRKPPPRRASSGNEPDPYMLTSTAKEDLHFLAIVYRDSAPPVAPKYFVSALGVHRLAYGQARVFNPTAFDTFTQEWQVTLEPADLLEGGRLNGLTSSPDTLSRIRSGASLISFGNVASFIERANVMQYWNNH